jgi:hypothetical protein
LVETEHLASGLGGMLRFQDICFYAGFDVIQHEQRGVHKFFFSMGPKKISASIDAAARASRSEVSERAAARLGWMRGD